MSLRIKTAPAVEPVTLAEARAHLRLNAAANYAVGVATQTVTLPALGLYTLTITGSGSVAIAAGTAVGTGWATATAAAPKTVNITTAGTVVMTVTGSVTAITLSPAQVDDSLISALIQAAREQCEAITRRALISQTWQLVLDAFPDEIAVPLPPLQTVESIKYINSEGVETTLSAAEYLVEANSEPARIVPAYGYSWPSIRGDLGGITVEYEAGYGDTAADVPQSIKNAILLEIERLFERDPKTMEGLEMARDALLSQYRILTF